MLGTPSGRYSQRPNSDSSMGGLDVDQVPTQSRTRTDASEYDELANYCQQPDAKVQIPTQSVSQKKKDTKDKTRLSSSENKSSTVLGAMGSFLSSIISNRRETQTSSSEDDLNELAMKYENKISGMDRNFRDVLASKEREWKESYERLRASHSHSNRDLERLQARLRESESEKRRIQEEYNTFFLQQQEASFKRVGSRWSPKEETKITQELDRLKRDMRSWSKETSLRELQVLQSLEEPESNALMQELEEVVLRDNHMLPIGLSSAPRAPMLLLNALLSHKVYSSFFRNPFFFLKDGNGDDLSKVGLENEFERIYLLAEETNQKDAHIWRSDTLRLLMPPLRHDTSETEKKMHSRTEAVIGRIANQAASDFLKSPARHLVNSETKANFAFKLQNIFREAALISYMLWTQRTHMRFRTLHQLAPLIFNGNTSRFTADNLVRYEGQEERLKGSVVTVMVHPLLEVYGTDEAEDYEKGRVWAAGVVWFDNRDNREL